MNSTFFALAAVLTVGLLLVGCTQYAAQPSPSASAQPSLVPETSQGSGSMASPSPSASPGGSDSYMDDAASEGVDETGSDVDDLESLSDDLSAGDVEYFDEGG